VPCSRQDDGGFVSGVCRSQRRPLTDGRHSLVEGRVRFCGAMPRAIQESFQSRRFFNSKKRSFFLPLLLT